MTLNTSSIRGWKATSTALPAPRPWSSGGAWRRSSASTPTSTIASPRQGLPDMVFTANAGLVLGREVVLSRFFHPERQGEEPHFKQLVRGAGFAVHELPKDLPFEGAGDALLDRERGCSGPATDPRTRAGLPPALAAALGVEVLSLRLIDKRFYHLDTCFCPLDRRLPPVLPGRVRRLFQPPDRKPRRQPEKRIAVDRNRRREFRLQRRQHRAQHHPEQGGRGTAQTARRRGLRPLSRRR